MKSNYLIFSDIHIKEQDLSECQLVLDEILSLCDEYKITHLFNLGDSFDNTTPGSKELDLYSEFVKKVNLPIIMISADSHESETHEDSVVNHFGILNKNVKVVKEYTDGCKLFLGHFGLSESKLQKYGATHSVKEFSKYEKVILGHYHSYEEVGDNAIQLGACRWISFAESQDKSKYVYIILDYGSPNEKVNKIALKSPYPMIDLTLDLKAQISPVSSPNLTHLRGILDSLPENTKVRVLAKDYSLFREFLQYEEIYKKRFNVFKVKKDFVIDNVIIAKKENLPLKDLLISWMEKNKVNEQIREVLLGELK